MRLGLIGLGFLMVAATAVVRPGAAEPNSQATLTASVKVNLLEVGLSLREPHGDVGVVVAAVEVENRGASGLRHLDVTLRLAEDACLRVVGPARHHRGRLRSGEHVEVSWRLAVTPNSAGCDGVVVLARASAIDAEGDTLVSESKAQLVVLTTDDAKPHGGHRDP